MEAANHDIADLSDLCPSVTEVTEFEDIGHLMIAHDGRVTWDELQAVKTAIWGADARAIEVYPAEGNIVNSANVRHLWRLGASDWAPDMVGEDGAEDSLRTRYAEGWAEARAVFRVGM